MSGSLNHLTQAELLALALDASRREDANNTLLYLKAAVERTDASPQAHFMLGSEYAHLGLTSQAINAMTQAVALDTEFAIARFQLGMLHITSGDADAAKAAWAPLAMMDPRREDAFFKDLHQGMLHLIADEFEPAKLALGRGIAANLSNDPLNRDMLRIIDAIDNLPGLTANAAPRPDQPPNGPDNARPPGAAAEEEATHLFISAYGQAGKPH